MNFAGYVSRRMLYEVCNIAVLKDSNYEYGYNALYDWTIFFTSRAGPSTIARLPSCKQTSEELFADILVLYSGILRGVDSVDSLLTVKCLFTISFYMMKKYKDDPVLCSDISTWFQLISYRLGGWSILANNYENQVWMSFLFQDEVKETLVLKKVHI